MISLLGTGSFAYAVTEDGTGHYYGGLGPLLGDEGSGFDIGRGLLAAALLRDLGEESRSKVLEAAASAFGLPDVRGVLYAAYTHRWPRREIASLSRLASELAQQGDDRAGEVIRAAMMRAADQVGALAKRLQWESTRFRYSATGGVVLNSPFARDALLLALRERLPLLEYEAPRVRPVLGCAVEGIIRAGWLPPREAVQRLQGQEGTPPSPD